MALARAALDRIDEIPSLARAFAGLTATRTLIVADEHAAARAVLEQAMDAARERGASKRAIVLDLVFALILLGGARVLARSLMERPRRGSFLASLPSRSSPAPSRRQKENRRRLRDAGSKSVPIHAAKVVATDGACRPGNLLRYDEQLAIGIQLT